MLESGDSVPEFDVETIGGSRARYGELWQRRNLLLVALSEDRGAANDQYVRRLSPRMAELTAHETECVVTVDHIPGLDPPGVIVADRWGEIHHVLAAVNIGSSRCRRVDRVAPVRAVPVSGMSG